MTWTQKWIAFVTITNKEITRFLRIWTQTLLPPVITQTLYFAIFGGFIGSRINQFTVNGQSLTYMQFIVPGLVMMAVIASSFSNVVSSFFGSKFQKNIEELLVSPVPKWIILNGYVTGGVARGILVGLIVFIISFIFATPAINNFWWITVFIILTSVIFSLAGFLNSIFAKKFDDITIFQTFVLTPLTYLGGVFYLIRDLPEIWQTVSRFNPILYMINGFRYGFYGNNFSDVNVYLSLWLLIFLTGSLYVINLYLLNRGVGMKS